ncbi:MAG: hypothetical protein IKB42_04890 [Clostridia bacterium]|nr:hypothetical protein [Clostridia bacterium]
MATPKKTRRASIFSMIISIIMLIAYYIIGQVYIVIAALSEIGTDSQALTICMNIAIYIGMVVMALGVINIVLSILTLIKTHKKELVYVPKAILLTMMILLLALTALNFVIFAILVVPMQFAPMSFIHLGFALFYLPCAMGIVKNFKYFIRLTRRSTSTNEEPAAEQVAE